MRHHERELFNQGKEYQTPARLLYLLARCVKGAVRYGLNGQMNQSADKRRHGTKPATIRKNALLISSLLKGKCSFTALDYKEVLSQCGSDDFIYMIDSSESTSSKPNRDRSSLFFLMVLYRSFRSLSSRSMW